MAIVVLVQVWFLSHAGAMAWCGIGAAVSLVWLWHSFVQVAAGMGFCDVMAFTIVTPGVWILVLVM